MQTGDYVTTHVLYQYIKILLYEADISNTGNVFAICVMYTKATVREEEYHAIPRSNQNCT